MAQRKAPIFHPPADAHGGNQCGTVERLLASYGVPPPTAGNRVELVTSGVDAYQRVMRLIEQARSTIHITTYILGSDEGSQALVACLTRRAAEGVSVRLLLDDVGSWRVRRRIAGPADRGRRPGRLLHADASHPVSRPGEPEEPSQAGHRRQQDRAGRRHEPCVAVYRAAGLQGPVARSIDGRRRAGGIGAGGALRVGLAVHHRPRPDRARPAQSRSPGA